MIGCVFSIVYLIFCILIPKMCNKVFLVFRQFIIYLTVFGIALVFIYTSSPKLQEDYGDIIDFGFEAFINLVENAIKASQEDHNISIRCESLQNEILLIVEDEGCGISPQHLDKITQPFYMVDEVRTTRNNGLGLGLAICKKIIQLHQGELIIESQIDQGTKIMVKFLKIGGEAL